MAYKPNESEDVFEEYSAPQRETDSDNNSESSVNISIQDTKLQNIKTEIKQDLTKEFQTQIQTEVQAATAPLGNITGYVTSGAIALSVISILVLIVIRNEVISAIKKLKLTVNSQKETIEKLTNELNVAKSEIRTLKNSSEISMPRYVSENLSSVHELENSPQSQKIQAPPQFTTSPSLNDKLKEFMEKFNALADFRGSERIKLREEFFNKYQIKGFSCQNYNELMNNPNLEPKFETLSNPINCDYWAYEISSDKFAVVPNVKNYNENYHIARAMGIVFNSNFVEGNYSNIRVKNPEIFSSMWHLSEKGELVLS